MKGRVVSISIAPAKQGSRITMEGARLIAGFGLEGDAYGGPGPRQLVLFSREARLRVDLASRRGLCYSKFRENIGVEGLDPGSLSPGTLLAAGEAVLRISEAKKRCYPECTLPREECAISGHLAFCEVLRGGWVDIGGVLREVDSSVYLEFRRCDVKLSARNQLKGTVKSITEGAVNSEVVIEVAPGVEITAVITRASVASLGLKTGSTAYAVIKASNVMVGAE